MRRKPTSLAFFPKLSTSAVPSPNALPALSALTLASLARCFEAARSSRARYTASRAKNPACLQVFSVTLTNLPVYSGHSHLANLVGNRRFVTNLRKRTLPEDYLIKVLVIRCNLVEGVPTPSPFRGQRGPPYRESVWERLEHPTKFLQ